jgi:hypothetical protein
MPDLLQIAVGVACFFVGFFGSRLWRMHRAKTR